MTTRPGNVARIEAELTPAQRTALDELCAACGIDRVHWYEDTAARSLFTSAAVAQLADRLRSERGLSAERALGEASAQLGISEETVKARQKRRRRRRGAKRTYRDRDGAASFTEPGGQGEPREARTGRAGRRAGA